MEMAAEASVPRNCEKMEELQDSESSFPPYDFQFAGLWSDVTFITGSVSHGISKAHKLIYRAGSLYFDGLFNQDKKKNVFTLRDVEPQEFYHLNKFMYTGQIGENIEDPLALFHVAWKYGVYRLASHCGKILYAKSYEITAENALAKYQQAVKDKDPELKEKALECICSNGNKVINSPDFLKLTIKELAGILCRDDLQVTTEAHLFDAVLNWGRAELKRQKVPDTRECLRSVLEEVIPLIRFPTMDPKDFRARVLPADNILLATEVTMVLVEFSVPEAERVPVPNALFNSKPRTSGAPKGTGNANAEINEATGNPNAEINEPTGVPDNKFIPPFGQQLVFRFKVNWPIKITKIGLSVVDPATQVTFPSAILNHIPAREGNCFWAGRIPGIIQQTSTSLDLNLRFCPLLVLPNIWYTAVYNGFGLDFEMDRFSWGERIKTPVDFKMEDGSDRLVKFEFVNLNHPKFTGRTQGIIPEIEFMVE